MFNALSALISTFFSICIFRLAPQDLPSSNFLLRSSLVSYLFLNLVLAGMGRPPVIATIIALVDAIFMVAFTLIALQVLNLRVRTTQTLTAQAGTGALLHLISLPLAAWQLSGMPGGSDFGALPVILSYLMLSWTLLVQGHIFRHAFSTNWTSGVVLALLSFWMQFTLMDALLRGLASA